MNKSILEAIGDRLKSASSLDDADVSTLIAVCFIQKNIIFNPKYTYNTKKLLLSQVRSYLRASHPQVKLSQLPKLLDPKKLYNNSI